MADTIMAVIYILVGIIALCGLVGAGVFGWYRFRSVVDIVGDLSASEYAKNIEHEYFNYFNRIIGVDPDPDMRRVLFVNSEYERIKGYERTRSDPIPEKWGDLPIDDFYKPDPVNLEAS